MKIENIDKYCFIWSILASLHPCNKNHPNKDSNYKQNLIELNIDGFDFTNVFKCSDVHKFNELNNLSIKMFELIFYQDQNKWRHKLVPIEVSKNESDSVTDLLIYKNHYAPYKKLNVFLGYHNKKFKCRRCLNSYTRGNMLMIHKPKCEIIDIITIRTSLESHLHWKKHFQKNPLFFRIYLDFEDDNEKDKSSIGNKTTNNYKQNPVLNGYCILCGLEGVLSYSKNYKFDEYKKCLDEEEYQQEYDNYLFRSRNHEMYLQRVRKSTLSQFDDKRCYKNKNESIP